MFNFILDVPTMTAIWAVGTCLWAIWAIIFWYFQVQINKKMVENQIISEIFCYWDISREYDDSPMRYKLQFQVKWNNPVDILYILLWDQFQYVWYTLIGEDIVHFIEILEIWDQQDILVFYRDSIWRYYKKRFIRWNPVRLWKTVLWSDFKELMDKKEIIPLKAKLLELNPRN